MEFDHHKHSVGGSNYHLQFTPKYRRKYSSVDYTGELFRTLFKQKARQLGIQLEDVEISPNP
jgi:REP element-mobilizing transposase RayT